MLPRGTIDPWDTLLLGVECIVCRAILHDKEAERAKMPGAAAPMCDDCVRVAMDGFLDHVVAVAIAREGDDGNVVSLMVQRAATNAKLPLHWEDPGGKVEFGESYAAAALREMEEEVGLPRSVQITKVGSMTNSKRKIHVFVGEAPVGWEPTLREGQEAAAWVPVEDRANLAPQLGSVVRVTHFLRRACERGLLRRDVVQVALELEQDADRPVSR